MLALQQAPPQPGQLSPPRIAEAREEGLHFPAMKAGGMSPPHEQKKEDKQHPQQNVLCHHCGLNPIPLAGVRGKAWYSGFKYYKDKNSYQITACPVLAEFRKIGSVENLVYWAAEVIEKRHAVEGKDQKEEEKQVVNLKRKLAKTSLELETLKKALKNSNHVLSKESTFKQRRRKMRSQAKRLRRLSDKFEQAKIVDDPMTVVTKLPRAVFIDLDEVLYNQFTHNNISNIYFVRTSVVGHHVTSERTIVIYWCP